MEKEEIDEEIQESEKSVENGKEEEEKKTVLLTEEEITEKLKEAEELLKEKDFSSAITLFEEVLDTQVEKYGDLGIECAPTYYKCGDAILNKVRYEVDILGNAIKKKYLEKQKLGLATTGEEEDMTEETNDINEMLEDSFQFLEVARVIYSKNEKCKLELSDVLLTLGDLGLESDNISQGIEDYEQCLKIRESILPSSDRRLAEIHFQLGRAEQCSNNVRQDKVLHHFTKAKQILSERLEISKTENPSEVKDLQEIIDELSERIDEVVNPPPAPSQLLEQIGFGNTSFTLDNTNNNNNNNLNTSLNSSTLNTSLSENINAPTSNETYLQPKVKRKIPPTSSSEIESEKTEKEKKLKTN